MKKYRKKEKKVSSMYYILAIVINIGILMIILL